MSKTFVMYRHGEYGVEEVGDKVTFPQLKVMLGGWPEIAMKVDVVHKDSLMPGIDAKDFGGLDGMMVICDSDGHPKGLHPTWTRPWDMAPLVGNLYWLGYKSVFTDDGPDDELYPLPQKIVDVIVTKIKDLGWAELVHAADTDEKEYPLSGGAMGVS